MYTWDQLREDRDLSPFQGPDLFGSKTLPIWCPSGVLGKNSKESWAPFKITPWKPVKGKTTATVELSQRTFHKDGMEFHFWALAPTKPGYRSQSQSKTHEFVWLTLVLGNGRGVHHALVDKETGEVDWWDKHSAVYQEVAS